VNSVALYDIIKAMDDAVGSINVNKLLSDLWGAYILGLWCADGYHYKQAKTFCLYISRYETKNVIDLLLPFSAYLQKRLTFITP